MISLYLLFCSQSQYFNHCRSVYSISQWQTDEIDVKYRN